MNLFILRVQEKISEIIMAIIDDFLKLWHGQLLLTKAFWGYFVFGRFIFIPIASLLALPFLSIGAESTYKMIKIVIYIAYRIVSSVGVWRSANALREKNTINFSIGNSVGIFMAKFMVFICVIKDIGNFTGMSLSDFIHSLATI